MNKALRAALYALAAVLVVVLIRTAWYGDDSYITLRTVDNWRHGHGLTWNVDERVQAYTHPLWMLVSTGLVSLTNEYYLTLLLGQIALTLGAVYLVVKRLLTSDRQRILFLLTLIMSVSFIEYATSGLENALSYFLIIWFATTLFEHKTDQSVTKLCLIGSLAVLNRFDLLLMVAPALAILLWPRRRQKQTWRQIIIGTSPLLVWLAFSLFYYGFFVPNTALAKLNTGIPALTLIKQGLLYYLNVISQDPLTLIVIIFGFALAIRNRAEQPRAAWLSLGGILYLLYVVKIGGDYMSGRFFALPLLLAAALMWREQALGRSEIALQATAIILIGCLAATPNVISNRNYGQGDTAQAVDGAFVVNERFFYYPDTGLITYKIGQPAIRSGFYQEGERFKAGPNRVVIFPTIGFAGFTAGPDIHIVDQYALSEPLLARLPIMKSDLSPAGWRIGHFKREIPCGYLETLKSGQNQICDGDLAEYYEHLIIVTRGPLFSWTRIKNIISFNLGRYDHLIESYIQRHPEIYDFDKSI